MPERDGYVPGVPCWVDATVPDPDAAVDFYGGLFGWQFDDVTPAGVDGRYVIARAEVEAGWSIFDSATGTRGGDVAAIGSLPPNAPPRATWNTYFWVDSAEDVTRKVREAGGTVVHEPFDFLDLSRVAVFTDPEGAYFCVWEARAHKGATLVNDPGSLNFNGLGTRDIEGAKAFYGAVFGWKTLDMGGGMELWTLDGYGDYLEGYHPKLREQMAEAQAPEGFEDVVAQLMPIPDDQPDTPPHWSVTFATADADATAAKAEELGGTVILPPFDAPWTRVTAIADSQGAMFVASKFAPENKDLGG